MATPIRYTIKCEKDSASVKATYDLSVPEGGSALIASFSLTVDGKELIDQTHWIPGQTRFNGAQFTRLDHPDQDVVVTFSVSTNEAWSRADEDTLVGPKRFDEVIFSNV